MKLDGTVIGFIVLIVLLTAISAIAAPPPRGDIQGYVWMEEGEDAEWTIPEVKMPGVTVSLYDASTGRLLTTTQTGVNGWYYFEGLGTGMFTVVEEEMPGFLDCSSNSMTVSAGTNVNFCDKMTPIEFGNWQIEGTGFWKQQFALATYKETGHTHIAQAQLRVLLRRLTIEWYDFIGPMFSFEVGYGILDSDSNEMEDKAKRQCFATLLNYANGAVGMSDMVDTDGNGSPDMLFSDAMEDALNGYDYLNNKDICEAINNM